MKKVNGLSLAEIFEISNHVFTTRIDDQEILEFVAGIYAAKKSTKTATRAEFECEWAKLYGDDRKIFIRHHNSIEQYANADTQCGWRGWQICHAHFEAPHELPGLSAEDIQQKAVSYGFKYWRSPDEHGVTGSTLQAVELLQDLLGVEVEITTPSKDLFEALKVLYEETADYIRRNNLGDVHHNLSMQLARNALEKTTGSQS